MSIFDSSIVRQADIYSYSVIVTVTAGELTLAFEVDDDDDDAFKRDEERIIKYQRCMINMSIL